MGGKWGNNEEKEGRQAKTQGDSKKGSGEASGERRQCPHTRENLWGKKKPALVSSLFGVPREASMPIILTTWEAEIRRIQV
jgi:hypothetical protein